MKVLIVGAGPTGLTAGVELARRGIHAEVIDRKSEPSGLSRAAGILPSSLGILAPSGVAKDLLEEGIKIQEARLFIGARQVLSLPLKGGHPDRDYIIALAQDRTERVLRNALIGLGGSVTFDREFIYLDQNDEQIVVGTSDGNESVFDMVIGADGIHSKVRESLGIGYPGFDLPETWSIADVDVQNWSDNLVFTSCLLSEGRVVVIVPLEAKRFRVISNTKDALASLPLQMDITTKRREEQFNISIRQASRYNIGRVFLAGDAAHCHSPAGGRGMNLGISDAAELASRIATNSLNGYGTSRRQAAVKTIEVSEKLRKLLTSKSFLTRLMTTTACYSINLFPFLQRSLAKTILDG